MLRYTARYLLSRTLRTVLSKYLLDVDVDSVVIPVPYGDYYASSELGGTDGSGGDDDAAAGAGRSAAGSEHGQQAGGGDGGGWGVRLSNVQLREGVSLMTLPGRRKHVVRRRRKRVRQRQQHHQIPPPDEEGPDQDVMFEPADDNDASFDEPPQSPPRRSSEHNNNNMTPGTPFSMDMSNGVFLSPTPSYGEEDSSYPSGNDCDNVLLGGDDDFNDVGKGRVLGYGIPSSPGSGAMTPHSSPPTPPASSWACFARGGGTADHAAATAAAVAAAASAAKNTSRPSRSPSSKADINQYIFGPESLEDGRRARDDVPIILPMNKQSHSAAAIQKNYRQTSVHTINTNEVTKKLRGSGQSEEGHFHPAWNDKYNGSYDADNDFEYYEEEITIEEEMELKVGHGGRVGTLHIRIIGKDYHITVEDADLVMEIVPKAAVVGEDGAVPNAEEGKGSTSSAASGDKVGSVGTEAPASGSSNSAEPESTEDKVMQNSRLARYLAAIPNLYLRDCRVRIVTKNGEKGFDSKTEEAEEEIHNSGGETNAAEEDQEESKADGETSSSSTAFVLGIDFLSVTGGEDFLAHARGSAAENGDVRAGQSQHSTSDMQQIRSASSFRDGMGDDSQNDFLRKRVRTGKGPGGGIWCSVLTPLDKRRYPLYFSGRPDITSSSPSPPPSQMDGKGTADGFVGSKWAIRSFINASNNNLLRLSGLDIHARILLGRRKELATREEIAQTDVAPADDYYYDYDADLVVFGVDYVGVTSNPRDPNQNGTSETNDDAVDAGEEIETIPIRSNFHRIGRGMRRHRCRAHHLPSTDCPQCWYQSSSSPSQVQFEHEADSTMPLPGLVLYFAITDPLELNIERQGLESLRMLKSLFTSSSQRDADNDEGKDSVKEERTSNIEPSVKSSRSCEPSACSGWQCDVGEKIPSFMTPETVHVVGVHVASFCLRLHAMRNDRGQEDGLSFCYWEMNLSALTVDSQNLNAKQLAFKDTRISIGQILLYELKGVCRKRLVTVGLDPAVAQEQNCGVSGSSDSSSIELCTAATILDISSSHDSLALLHRNENAVHFRFISVPISSEVHPIYCIPLARSCIDVKVGVIDADLSPGFSSDLMTAKNEALATLSGSRSAGEDSIQQTPQSKPKEEQQLPKTRSSSSTSCMEYSVRLDGGKFNMRPRIKCSFPSTYLTGQSSSTEGFSIHSVLNRIKMEYGQRSPHPKTDRGGISILHLAHLAEASRLRILLYLDDLAPLEKALDLKKTGKHAFMRCHAISQRIRQFKPPPPPAGAAESNKLPRRREGRRKNKSKKPPKGDRKQQLVAQLMNLDEAELDRLLAAHH